MEYSPLTEAERMRYGGIYGGSKTADFSHSAIDNSGSMAEQNFAKHPRSPCARPSGRDGWRQSTQGCAAPRDAKVRASVALALAVAPAMREAAKRERGE